MYCDCVRIVNVHSNLKGIVSATFLSTSLLDIFLDFSFKLWKLFWQFFLYDCFRIQLIGFTVKNIYFWSQNHTGCRRYCSKFLGNSNFSIRAPSLKYLSIFVAFIEYHSNIVIPNTWVWANTRKSQVFHHSATRKVPETLISLQLKLLNSGKNFDLVCLNTYE